MIPRPIFRSPRPRFAILGLVAVLFLGRMAVGYLPGEDPDSPLQGEPISSAVAQEGSAPVKEPKAKSSAPRFTEEEVQVLTELREQRQGMEKAGKREEETQERLKILREKVAKDLDRFKRYRDQIQTGIQKEKEIRSDKMDHLVDVYANMNPEKAAERIDRMERDTAVKLLSRMNGQSAGRILSFVDPDKANRISQSMTKMVDEIQ